MKLTDFQCGCAIFLSINSEWGFLLLCIFNSIGIFRLLEFSHIICMYVVVSHYCFNLLLSNNSWFWASFHMLTFHLYILFGELPVQIFCLLYRVLSIFWIHVLPGVCFACLFSNLKNIFHWEVVFKFNKVQVNFFHRLRFLCYI